MDGDKTGKYSLCVEKSKQFKQQVRTDVPEELSCDQIIKNLGLQSETKAPSSVFRALNEL